MDLQASTSFVANVGHEGRPKYFKLTTEPRKNLSETSDIQIERLNCEGLNFDAWPHSAKMELAFANIEEC